MYILLAQTALSLGAFVGTVILTTELGWFLFGGRPRKYKTSDLVKALIIGGCPKLLGLLGIVWQHVSPDLHNALIHGYGALCLLTAYSGKQTKNKQKTVNSVDLLWIHLSNLFHLLIPTGKNISGSYFDNQGLKINNNN